MSNINTLNMHVALAPGFPKATGDQEVQKAFGGFLAFALAPRGLAPFIVNVSCTYQSA